ncbi:MAG: hypothetical protein RLZZ172_2939, partial [Bacteroidota bacterium]
HLRFQLHSGKPFHLGFLLKQIAYVWYQPIAIFWMYADLFDKWTRNVQFYPFEATLYCHYKNGKGILDNWHTMPYSMPEKNPPKGMFEHFQVPIFFF